MGNVTPSDPRPLSALEALARENPTQLMAQLRAFWPQVQEALKAGHTLRLIHKRLNMAGVPISYKLLSLYRGRIERRKKHRPPRRPPPCRLHPDRRSALHRHSIPWPICARRNRNGRAGSIRQALPTKASSFEETGDSAQQLCPNCTFSFHSQRICGQQVPPWDKPALVSDDLPTPGIPAKKGVQKGVSEPLYVGTSVKRDFCAG